MLCQSPIPNTQSLISNLQSLNPIHQGYHFPVRGYIVQEQAFSQHPPLQLQRIDNLIPDVVGIQQNVVLCLRVMLVAKLALDEIGPAFCVRVHLA